MAMAAMSIGRDRSNTAGVRDSLQYLVTGSEPYNLYYQA